MSYFQSFDGEKIHYHILNQAQSNKEAIIILHGLGGDILLIRDFITHLAHQNPDKQIISYYLRGHGPSSHSYPKNISVIEDIHVQDLLALISFFTLKNNQFSLIGHSLGGIIIQEYLKVKSAPTPLKVFLVCTTTKIFGSTFIRKKLFSLLKQRTHQSPYDSESWKPQPKEFYENFRTSWDINLFRLKHDISLVGGFFNWLLILLAFHGWENKDITTLNKRNYYYIYGKKDIIVPAITQESFLKKTPLLSTIKVPAGHIAPITHPDEIATIITQELKL